MSRNPQCCIFRLNVHTDAPKIGIFLMALKNYNNIVKSQELHN